MTGSLLRRQLLRPQERLTFEQRLEKAFPGSEWISTQSGPTEGQQIDPNSDPGGIVAPVGAIAVIGGAKFDEASLVNWLRTLPRDVILVTTAPRLTKSGDPHAADFAGKLLPLTKELGLRVDFVPRREHQYGTYAEAVQLREIIRVTSGDVVLVGTGGKQNDIKAIANGDWAIAKATLGGRELLEVG